MGYYALYLDESGKVDKSDFTSLCGYVAPTHEWMRFQYEWDALIFKYGVPPIHMGQIMSPNPKDEAWKKKQEEWGKYWEFRRDEMLAAFASMIKTSGVVCVGAVVDSAAYRRIREEIPDGLFYKDSNLFVLQHAIMLALDRIEKVDERPSVSIVLDHDAENVIAQYEYLENLKQMETHPITPPEFKERFARIRRSVHSLSFANDKFYCGLQAADMVSYAARNYKVSRLSDPSAEMTDNFANLTAWLLSMPGMFDEEHLYRIARRENTKGLIANETGK